MKKLLSNTYILYEENYDSILMNSEQRFVLLSVAKLRREFEENKKTAEFLMKLLRQSHFFATKQGDWAKRCPM